jgi:uncharacterized protein (TIGR02246 family)
LKKLNKAPAHSVDRATHAAIENVLQTYETKLNASDADGVLTVFSRDGVFMAPNRASMVGSDAIRATYVDIFQSITFDTELTVEEIVQVSQEWAFVRTNSNGHVTVNAIEQRIPDANHELFILRKGSDDAWKIARYSFATTLPLRE